ncbi:MAG: TrmH family RNA methyltransferase [Acidobacteriia bacterium]|nr:TrmH family RNA methyltransferase [Terriglobia bacterium]
MERTPFLATHAAASYEHIKTLPVAVVLDNVRSMYNVGSFFRTGDAAAIEKIVLSGITAKPPKKEITKTALGAEDRLPWEHTWDPSAILKRFAQQYWEIAAIETSPRSVDLFDWRPRFPVCLLFGHEVDGIQPHLLEMADTFVRIPMLGHKHSLNVATAGGVVIYELLRKYRALIEASA